LVWVAPTDVELVLVSIDWSTSASLRAPFCVIEHVCSASGALSLSTQCAWLFGPTWTTTHWLGGLDVPAEGGVDGEH
jgi:hypothetical protein